MNLYLNSSRIAVVVAGEVFVNILMYVCFLECLFSEVYFISATGCAFGIFINVPVSFKTYFTQVCFLLLFLIFLLSQTLHIQLNFSVVGVSKHVFGSVSKNFSLLWRTVMKTSVKPCVCSS